MTDPRPFCIDGIVPIVPTPFDASECIAWEEVPTLIDFALLAGACAVCLPAYASEFYKLSEDERVRLAAEAVRHADGRLPVIGQVNHYSSARTVEMAVGLQRQGVSAICAAVPHMFSLPEHDLRRHFDRLLRAVDVPVIIQDVNPNGSTLSPRFVAELARAHPHLRYLKLEEPLMAAKVDAIRQQTGGAIGVIEGWGGMYLLELIDAGICGVMPGLAVSDILATVLRLARSGDREQAYQVFQQVLPQIVFSLQHMELFHHAEKLLLHARGVLSQAHVRGATLTLHPSDEAHIRRLNGHILTLLDRLNLPHAPATLRSPVS
jgi:dihydrodipicolinate synthase/N-acetylneuraminate lyase